MTESPETWAKVLLFGECTSWIKETERVLTQNGMCGVLAHSDNRTLLKFLEQNKVALVVIDMSDSSGKTEILNRIRIAAPSVKIIIESVSCDVEFAVECMKAGVADFLVKPVEPGRLIKSIATVLNTSYSHLPPSLSMENPTVETLKHSEAFSEITSISRVMRLICQYTETVACSPQPILITGETGVGKELFARAIHRISRANGAFVSINVAGLDDTMFSDTLFGHKKSAFTGADQCRDGLVSKAASGTLFLDEIGDLNELSQVKLLRLLQEGEYYPVGADHVKKSTARIVLATNVNLLERIKKGSFRRDLYYRLCTHQIHIPPLRERKEDIPALFAAFIKDSAKHFAKRVPEYSEELTHVLTSYDFPGNIRELQAIARDAVARNRDGILTPDDFPETCRASSQRPPAPVHTTSLPTGIYGLFGHLPTFREIEDFLIVEALKLSEGNYAAAASILGVARQTVSKRIKSINSDS